MRKILAVIKKFSHKAGQLCKQEKQCAINSIEFYYVQLVPHILICLLFNIIMHFCRWKPGVASSLNYFIMSDEKSPVFYPYPSWEVNTLPEMPVNNSKNGNSRMKLKIYSSFRLRIDECDRLWVIDSGLTDISSRFTQLAPPAIVIFDLHTDKLIKRFEIPKEYVKEDSFFSNIVSLNLIRESLSINVSYFRSLILKKQGAKMLTLMFQI